MFTQNSLVSFMKLSEHQLQIDQHKNEQMIIKCTYSLPSTDR